MTTTPGNTQKDNTKAAKFAEFMNSSSINKGPAKAWDEMDAEDYALDDEDVTNTVTEKKEEDPVPKPKQGKVQSPATGEGKPLPFNSTMTEVKEILLQSKKENWTLRSILESLWNREGVTKARGGVSAISRMVAEIAGTDYPDIKPKILVGNSNRMLMLSEGDDEPFWSRLSVLTEKKPKEKPAQQAAKEESVEEPNKGFDTYTQAQSTDSSPIKMVLQKLEPELINMVLVLTDRLAYCVPSPSKAISAEANKQKKEAYAKKKTDLKGKAGAKKELAGLVRRRFNPSMKHPEIIEFCVDPKHMGGLVMTRFPNPSQTYQAFLEMLLSLTDVKTGILDWSWGQLVETLMELFSEEVNALVQKGLEKLMESNQIGDGVWGPFLWRTHYKTLLPKHKELLLNLKQAGIMLPGKSLSKQRVPTEWSIHPLLNIPLPGSECQRYMDRESYKARVNIGVPWVKYGSDPMIIDRVLTPQVADKICNKSASEYKFFLRTQREAIRRVRRSDPKKSTRQQRQTINVDEW